MQIKININLERFKVNRIIKFFLLSDLFLLGGWGLIGPIFALFVVGKIPGADAVTVGVATAVYWLVKSIIQMPIAVYLDKHDGEKDDFYALIMGLFLAGFTSMSYVLVGSIGGLLVVEVLHAIAFALYAASWPTIFSRHLDKDKYSVEWTLNSISIGFAVGVSGLIGGVMAKFLGFESIFVAGSLLSFLSAIILLIVPDLILPKATSPGPEAPIIKNVPPLAVKIEKKYDQSANR